MINKPRIGHPHEYPIVKFWYTKHAGWTIEEIIDKDITFFEWVVNTFQDVTPAQAEYYKVRTGKEIPKEYIQDVTPYLWEKGDGEREPYMTICATGDLEGTLAKYRTKQFTLNI